MVVHNQSASTLEALVRRRESRHLHFFVPTDVHTLGASPAQLGPFPPCALFAPSLSALSPSGPFLSAGLSAQLLLSLGPISLVLHNHIAGRASPRIKVADILAAHALVVDYRYLLSD